MHFIKDRGYRPASRRGRHAACGLRAATRSFLGTLAAGAAGSALAPWAARDALRADGGPGKLRPLPARKSAVSGALTMDKPTPYQDVTTYNNFYEFGTDKSDPARHAGSLKTRPWTRGRRRRGQEARHLGPRRAAQAGADGRAHLPHALRRGLVDGDPLGRLLAGRADQARRAHRQRQVRAVRDPGRQEPDARAALVGARLALCRRPAPRRGDAPADAAGLRPVRRGAAQPERRAGAPGGALEVRLQDGQVDRAHPLRRQAAQDQLGDAPRPASTASIPTSTRRSTTRAGARPPSAASATTACSARSGRR